jgi:hypothetical protein
MVVNSQRSDIHMKTPKEGTVGSIRSKGRDKGWVGKEKGKQLAIKHHLPSV